MGKENEFLIKNPFIKEWLYKPEWQCDSVDDIDNDEMLEEKKWLIFSNPELSENISKYLTDKKQKFVIVEMGDFFLKSNDSSYTINSEDYENYDRLILDLEKNNVFPDYIVHFWNTKKSEDINLPFYRLLYLIKSFGKYANNFLKIGIVSKNLYFVDKDEVLLSPEQALLIGPCRVASKEYENIFCSNIDVSITDFSNFDLIENILNEMRNFSNTDIVAYRNNQRWTQNYKLFSDKDLNLNLNTLKDNGTYLITGGMGGMGFVFAEYLAKNHKAKLILINRSQFVERSNWDDYLNNHKLDDCHVKNIKKIKYLESFGSKVKVISVDISDYQKLEELVSEAENEFDNVNGVIHAAGVAGGGLIQLKTKNSANEVLKPKVSGVLALSKLFFDHDLDFFISCSSTTAKLSTIGQVDYCSANAYLDAFAYHHAERKKWPMVSINWDAWRDVGMVINTDMPSEMKQWFDDYLHYNGVSNDEGIEVFLYALKSKLPQIFLSTVNLNSRLEQNSISHKINIKDKIVDDFDEKQSSLEPLNDTENKIMKIWCKVLGLNKVGCQDNFFDLGGTSIQIIEVNDELKKIFDAHLTTTQLFQYLTIKSLSKYIDHNAMANNAALIVNRRRDRAKRKKHLLIN